MIENTQHTPSPEALRLAGDCFEWLGIRAKHLICETVPDPLGQRFDAFLLRLGDGTWKAWFHYGQGLVFEQFGRTRGRALRALRRAHAQI